MNKEIEHNLDNPPDIALGPEDLAAAPMADRQRSSSATDARERRAGSRGTAALVVLALAVGILGLGSYLYIRHFEQQLVAFRTVLEQTGDRVSEVSGTLSLSGEDVSRRYAEVKEELKEIDSEIRKLWDLSNKRNRAAIDSLQKKLTRLDSSLEQVNKTVDSSKAAVRKVQSQINSAVASHSDTAEQLSVLEKQVKKLANDSAETLQKIDTHITQNREKAKAVDAHRQQLNRRVLQLEESVRLLRAELG